MQKGPFVLGSTVDISPVDMAGNPTGEVYATMTQNDLGEFSIELPTPSAVAIEGDGFYYNEATGMLSTASITLRALYVPEGASEDSVHVNLVTHQTVVRVRTLLADGQDFGTAIATSEEELRVALGIGLPDLVVEDAGASLDILGGDTVGNAYLFAMSSVLAQAGVDGAGGLGGPVDAHLQALLNELSLDLGDDGAIAAPLRAAVDAAELALDTDAVEAALAQRLATIGSTAVVPDLDLILDQDGDLLVNADDNCPKVVNPDQANADADSHGDACDNCPDITNEDQADTDRDGIGDLCDAECGDGFVGPGEECDAGPDGSEACTDQCTLSVCGDGIIWPLAQEDCEGSDLRGWDCVSFGYTEGELGCEPRFCYFDLSDCEFCGDQYASGDEECDGLDGLQDLDCVDFGYAGGYLVCDPLACTIDPSAGCSTCGDDIVTGNEECDGDDLQGFDCGSWGFFGGGTLACHHDCTPDTSLCVP